MIEFRMPSLGADMDAGTLVEWLKQPGDALKRGDIIAVVETQKGAIEIEVFNDGILDAQLSTPGQKVPVGRLLATIRGHDEPSIAVPPAVTMAPPPAEVMPPVAPPPMSFRTPAESVTGRLHATPFARKRASELGIELANVMAGTDGVIGSREVESSRPPKALRKERGIDLGEMRKAISAAMARSAREIPHYYVSSTLDVSPMMSWLESENAARVPPQRLLYLAPILRATALALRKIPMLNGTFENGVFSPAARVNIGVGIALRGGGLISPAICDADTLDLNTLMARLSDLVARVRAGRLRSSELMEGTVTLSNLGERTADALLPLIYPPQVAIIGCGQIASRPWIDGGAVVARLLMTVTVAGDHRVSDGRRASQFLAALDELLKRPDKL
jgi:pyruvate dehydrogenase E2 component (dihydrolipoamide acetyltransferase)